MSCKPYLGIVILYSMDIAVSKMIFLVNSLLIHQKEQLTRFQGFQTSIDPHYVIDEIASKGFHETNDQGFHLLFRAFHQ